MGFTDVYKAYFPFEYKNVRKQSFLAFSVPMMLQGKETLEVEGEENQGNRGLCAINM